MFPFKYDRYSKSPITDNPPQIDIEKLKSYNVKTELTLDDIFEQYLQSLEKQRGYKYSRQEKRKLYKNFIKRNRR